MSNTTKTSENCQVTGQITLSPLVEIPTLPPSKDTNGKPRWELIDTDVRNEALALLRVSGLGPTAAGKELGVSAATVTRWSSTPEYKATERRVCGRILEDAKTHCVGLFRGALATFHRLLRSRSEDIQLRAATQIVRTVQALAQHQQDELQAWSPERLRAELERVRALVANTQPPSQTHTPPSPTVPDPDAGG